MPQRTIERCVVKWQLDNCFHLWFDRCQHASLVRALENIAVLVLALDRRLSVLIQVPDVKLSYFGDSGGLQDKSAHEIFGGKKVPRHVNRSGCVPLLHYHSSQPTSTH